MTVTTTAEPPMLAVAPSAPAPAAATTSRSSWASSVMLVSLSTVVGSFGAPAEITASASLSTVVETIEPAAATLGLKWPATTSRSPSPSTSPTASDVVKYSSMLRSSSTSST